MKTKFMGCNGRPQLWHSISMPDINGRTYDRLRIIYPNGKVVYWFGHHYPSTVKEKFIRGCTSRRNQAAAVLTCAEYSEEYEEDFVFLGYL